MGTYDHIDMEGLVVFQEDLRRYIEHGNEGDLRTLLMKMACFLLVTEDAMGLLVWDYINRHWQKYGLTCERP